MHLYTIRRKVTNYMGNSNTTPGRILSFKLPANHFPVTNGKGGVAKYRYSLYGNCISVRHNHHKHTSVQLTAASIQNAKNLAVKC